MNFRPPCAVKAEDEACPLDFAPGKEKTSTLYHEPGLNLCGSHSTLGQKHGKFRQLKSAARQTDPAIAEAGQRALLTANVLQQAGLAETGDQPRQLPVLQLQSAQPFGLAGRDVSKSCYASPGSESRADTELLRVVSLGLSPCLFCHSVGPCSSASFFAAMRLLRCCLSRRRATVSAIRFPWMKFKHWIFSSMYS